MKSLRMALICASLAALPFTIACDSDGDGVENTTHDGYVCYMGTNVNPCPDMAVGGCGTCGGDNDHEGPP